MWLQRLEGRELVFEGVGRTERHELPGYLLATWKPPVRWGDELIPERCVLTLVIANGVPRTDDAVFDEDWTKSGRLQWGFLLYRGSDKARVANVLDRLAEKLKKHTKPNESQAT